MNTDIFGVNVPNKTFSFYDLFNPKIVWIKCTEYI